MMDKIIHAHLDKRLDIQEEASKLVEQHLSFNFDKLLKNPESELAMVAQEALLVVEGFASNAAREGLAFAKAVKLRDKQDRPIVFVDSNDPHLNKEEGNGRSQD